MDSTHAANTKRIAKNTAVLYLRTIVTMVISLFTSRILLEALGVDNFGIANVVGGVVAMFSVISGSIAGSVSRFLTFALGEGDKDKLQKVFSISVNIMIGLSLLIALVGEIGGIWFINNKMNIPPDRIEAAHWVLQCSLLAFCIGLISTPYNACIIAHEKMNVFAYMTILDVALKLLFAYLVFITPFDKLITYTVLNLAISLFMRVIYGVYCVRKFEECHYKFATFDRGLVKDMTSFAWWGFFGNTAWMFNTQGVNILINMFFGVAYNAARGVAGQVEGAVMGFVGNFMTALTPQITKSYAAGDKEYLYSTICRGTKFSYYLMIVFAIPLWFEVQNVLDIWLAEVPPYSAIFLKLSLVCTILTTMANPLLNAIMATGKIKKYEIVTTVIGCGVFPITYIAYKMGAPILSTYFIYMFIYTVLIGVKLYFAKVQLFFPTKLFVKEVIAPISIVTALAFIPPFVVANVLPNAVPALLHILVITAISLLSLCASVYLFGLTLGEKNYLKIMVASKLGLKLKMI